MFSRAVLQIIRVEANRMVGNAVLKIVPMLFVLFNPCCLFGQEESGLISCGNAESFSALSPASLNECFVVEDIQSNCTKVWVKINMHFFLEDDCSGAINPTRSNIDTNTIRTAYQKADDLIWWFNYKLENNHQQWNQIPLWDIHTVQPAQCNPIRFALSGVYVHCNSAARNTSGSNLIYFKNNFAVNLPEEFNAFFVEWIGSSGGQASPIYKLFSAEDFSSSIFNHEFGHCLGLGHVFDNDGCEDTPRMRFQVDYNCDGDVADYFSQVGSESVWRRCWSLVTSPAPMDYNGNGVDYEDACNAPCVVEPCCDSSYLDNNVMSYSGYTGSHGAFTACQINEMLTTLSSSNYCPYIAQIGGDCPPPMANVHVFPDEAVSDDCTYCFQLMASMNEAAYKVEILRMNDNLIYNHGWTPDKAGKFCIARNPKYSNRYMHGLQPNTNYKLRLTLRSPCETESMEEFTFQLPPLPNDDCLVETAPFELSAFYPNPIENSLTVEYDAKATGKMDIFLVPAGSGNEMLLSSEYLSQPGAYRKTLNTKGIAPGACFLVLSLDGVVVSRMALKR